MSNSNSPKTAAGVDPLEIPEALNRVAGTTAATDPAADKSKIVSGTPPLVSPDPFNAKALRLPPAFEHNAGVRKVLSTIPVRKPHGQEWIRVHPGADYSDNFGVIILKDDNEYYLLHPNLVAAYENEMTRVRIFTAMSMNKNLFMWAAKLPGSGHKNSDSWNNSAIEAAEAAMKRKVRVQSNKAINAYEYYFSDNPTPENDPVWPDMTYDEMIRIAFAKPGRFIAATITKSSVSCGKDERC
jgi:hypothetical protein